MNKALPTTVVLLLLTAFCYSQSPQPAPKPIPPDDGDVVKISTNLIQVDVTVTDAKGKPVTDLRRDEIEIYENGQKQPITNFSFVSGAPPRADKPKVTDKTAIPVPQAILRPEMVRRTFALVVDDLSLSFESVSLTRRALKKFVDEQMQQGDMVAIIRTGAGIGALQQFTSDKRMLFAAIEKVKWNAQGTGGVSAFAPIQAPAETDEPASDDTSDDEAAAAVDPAARLDSFRSSVFATGTLGALRYIVTGMAELPGRKSVILFSDGFKIVDDDDAQSDLVLDFLRQLVDVANRSSVVFYTIDARGLVSTGFTAADQVSDTSPDAMEANASARRNQLLDTQEGLSYLAEETGGLAIKNNNDLSGGVTRALADQSYYLIGYEPDTDTFDPAKRKYNQLTIKVLRPGAKARYRSGFFNVADRETAGNTPASATPVVKLETALVSPFAVNGINLRLNALFGSDAKNGSFVRSLLHIDAADLKFTDEKNGTKKAVFDVLAMSFGDNGQTGEQLAKTYTLVLKPDAYKRTVADGFVYHFMFPVKKAGAYQYRVAIRDAQGGKVGSASQFIEVPELKKNRLTLSSVVIENVAAADWLRQDDPLASGAFRNPMSDTAVRRVKPNTVLRYGYEIYNARSNPNRQTDLKTKIRVFRDGDLILDGRETPVDLHGQTDLQHIKASGAVAIGKTMLRGDYILQIIVTDGLAKPKQNTATQIVQFEVTD
ncbi:MAG: VWA domain-containing protein [Pyrinomonadaceae bacterium]